MEKMRHGFGLRAVKGLAAVMATIPFALCWYLYYAERIYRPFYNKGNWVVIALFVAVYTMLAKIYDAFRISTNRISDMVYSQGLSAFLADCILFVVIWLLTRHLPNVLPGIAALAAQVLLSTIWALGAHTWYFKVFPPKKSAIVFDKHYAIERLIHE